MNVNITGPSTVLSARTQLSTINLRAGRQGFTAASASEDAADFSPAAQAMSEFDDYVFEDEIEGASHHDNESGPSNTKKSARPAMYNGIAAIFFQNEVTAGSLIDTYDTQGYDAAAE